MDLREINCKHVNQLRIRSNDVSFVIMVLKLLGSIVEFLISCVTINCSRKALYHGDSFHIIVYISIPQ